MLLFMRGTKQKPLCDDSASMVRTAHPRPLHPPRPSRHPALAAPPSARRTPPRLPHPPCSPPPPVARRRPSPAAARRPAVHVPTPSPTLKVATLSWVAFDTDTHFTAVDTAADVPLGDAVSSYVHMHMPPGEAVRCLSSALSS